MTKKKDKSNGVASEKKPRKPARVRTGEGMQTLGEIAHLSEKISVDITSLSTLPVNSGIENHHGFNEVIHKLEDARRDMMDIRDIITAEMKIFNEAQDKLKARNKDRFDKLAAEEKKTAERLAKIREEQAELKPTIKTSILNGTIAIGLSNNHVNYENNLTMTQEGDQT